jgi:hypothetical protein
VKFDLIGTWERGSPEIIWINLKKGRFRRLRCSVATLTGHNQIKGGSMRRLAGLVIMIFLASILVVGCGRQEEPKTTKPAAEKPAVEKKEVEKKEPEKKEPEKKEGVEKPKASEMKPKETKPGEAMPAAEKASEAKK